MERTLPLILQWDENFDVGADTGTPVEDADYQVPFRFNGTLDKLTLTVNRPKLPPGDEQKLREAQRNNRVSECPRRGGLIPHLAEPVRVLARSRDYRFWQAIG